MSMKDIYDTKSQPSVLRWRKDRGPTFERKDFIIKKHQKNHALYRIKTAFGMQVTVSKYCRFICERGIIQTRALMPDDAMLIVLPGGVRFTACTEMQRVPVMDMYEFKMEGNNPLILKDTGSWGFYHRAGILVYDSRCCKPSYDKVYLYDRRIQPFV
jgi:hypothetical protein